jgi:hypothetical protein
MQTTFNQTIQTPGGAVSSSVVKIHEAVAELDVTVASDAANAAIDFVLNVSRCNYLFMQCDQDVLVETNNSGSPTDTYTLKAGIPYCWFKGNGQTTLPTSDAAEELSDITSLFVTNQSSPATAGTLKIRVGYDPDSEVT